MLALTQPTSSDCLAAMSSHTPASSPVPPVAIRYRRFAQDESACQLLVFECAPSFSGALQGKGMALVELADGRVFFFRTSLAAMRDGPEVGNLFDELRKLPAWITDWNTAADFVGYMIGATLEFIDKDPSRIENWSIPEWKQHAASWLAVNQPMASIQQMNATIAQGIRQLNHELAGKLGEFMGALVGKQEYSLQGAQPYSWQSGHSVHNYFTSGSEQQQHYRRQAGATFPLIIEHLFACPKDESTLSIIQAIDNGVPLVEHTARLFNCHKKCIRHMVGIRLEEIGVQWAGRLRELLTILGSLDMNRLPKSKDEWSVFGETVDLLSVMTKMPTTSLSSRLLLGELSRQNWRRKIDANAGFRERALAIERLSENFRQAILATAWVNGKTCASIVTVQRLAVTAACSLGLSRLERLARKWMAEERRLDTEKIIHQADGFPVILEDPLEVGDMKVIQITSGNELTSEGKRMGSCVAGYAASCASGSTYIFSVRDGEGASRVTVEYRLEKSRAGMPELNLIQQKGIKNSVPDSQYEEALNALHRHTTTPLARKKLLNLVVYQEALKKKGSSIRAVRYIRSLEFIQFLRTENAGQLDFEKLVAEAVRQEEAAAT